MNENGRGLIVVDPQPDFFEGGALPVAGATRTAQRIAGFLRDHGDDYSLTIVTQDWHVDPGDHWSDEPNFETTWPVHCAAHSSGAAIHPTLADQAWDVVIRKGQHEGAYSGFDGSTDDGVTLFDVLSAAGINSLAVVGFATDHCVKATALDARDRGFEVDVLLDLCAGVDPDTTKDAIDAMSAAGVSIRDSTAI
ncbi:MAG: isochorismatase family protein [Acidimicrobiales bacterium]